MFCTSIILPNGDIVEGEKIAELIELVLNTLSKEGLSCAEAEIVLKEAKSMAGCYCKIKSLKGGDTDDEEKEGECSLV